MESFRSVQLVPMSPPFNIRREKSRSRSGYDGPDADQRCDVEDAISELLCSDCQVFVMCSAIWFAQWVPYFQQKPTVSPRGKKESSVESGSA